MTNLFELRKITTPEKASLIWSLIIGDLHPEEISEAAAAFSRACYSTPDDDLLILYAADEILGTCGIEGACPQDGTSFGYSYCNTGDPYDRTLFLTNGHFTVATLAGKAARHPTWR